MPDNSHDPQTNPTIPDDQAYTHLPEVRALRRVIARLEAQVDQIAPDDTAGLMRLAASIARVSDSITRALAAHHKLLTIGEQKRLDDEWKRLNQAVDDHHRQRREEAMGEKRRRAERAEEWRKTQEFWLTCLAEAGEEAAAGNPKRAGEFVANVRANLQTEGYVHKPDRLAIAALRERDAREGRTSWPSSP